MISGINKLQTDLSDPNVNLTITTIPFRVVLEVIAMKDILRSQSSEIGASSSDAVYFLTFDTPFLCSELAMHSTDSVHLFSAGS